MDAQHTGIAVWKAMLGGCSCPRSIFSSLNSQCPITQIQGMSVSSMADQHNIDIMDGWINERL
jgi:hypothetical protein